ncbi:hypothetical protein C4D60_Mb10t14860 [Musa balbisiana]|uniref:Secreted protein n=1 Tax=Musa balbisiana TaxID=52838 RepID=A0A4S8IY20_MUSBA|nr:hypothetical protein C4D60_Mb10t14860 [Musa balbisiana]
MTSPAGTVAGTLLLASLTAARRDAVRYCQGRSSGRRRPPSSGAARKRERKRATAFPCSRPFPMPPSLAFRNNSFCRLHPAHLPVW